jgi:tetratricopeptide (TPR) repeat protein
MNGRLNGRTDHRTRSAKPWGLVRLLSDVLRGIQDFMVPIAILLASLGLTWVPYAGAQSGDILTRSVKIETDQGTLTLMPVERPNLTLSEPVVRQALQAARERLVVMVKEGKASPSELAAAYGELGIWYHAHRMNVQGEACYRNAERLSPGDFRWPYYLGYLYQQTDQLQKAVTSFKRALEIRPDYAPAKLRLGQVYIELNEHDLAGPLLQQTVQVEGLRAAALFGLGRIALARRDYAKAVELLEQALRIRPYASRIHYPLAMAYRGLGNVNRARTHLEKYGDSEPALNDPEVDKLNAFKTGAKPHIYLAVEAVKARQYQAAAEAFSEVLKYEPENVNSRVSFARTLYLSGNRNGARQQLHEALKRAPDHVLANFLMGVLLESEGNLQAAIDHYQTALASDPRHGGVNHFFANALMREGRYAEAARHYAEAIRQFPQNSPARLMEVLALYRGGTAHSALVQRLEEAMSRDPENPMFVYVYARLLAASPDANVRDGPRALSFEQRLMSPFPSAELAETLAMVYAEVGRYEEAVSQQSEAIEMAYMMNRLALVPRLEQMLARYKDGQPCRIPFADDDPIFQPAPVNPDGPFSDYPWEG